MPKSSHPPIELPADAKPLFAASPRLNSAYDIATRAIMSTGILNVEVPPNFALYLPFDFPNVFRIHAI